MGPHHAKDGRKDARLALEPDRVQLQVANGDLAYIAIQPQDTNGCPFPTGSAWSSYRLRAPAKYWLLAISPPHPARQNRCDGANGGLPDAEVSLTAVELRLPRPRVEAEEQHVSAETR